MTCVNIHASCAAIGRQGALKGVLILGDSGAGKSDLLLRLMDDGARLVADDRAELFVANGRLCARPPRNIAGLMEVRGLGIVAQPFVKSVPLALAVRLGAGERLPAPEFYAPPPRLAKARPVPAIRLDGAAASAPARIRLTLKAIANGLIRNDFLASGPGPK